MQAELKTFGRGKDATVHKLVGKLTLKADTKAEAEQMAELGAIIQRPDLLTLLTWLGTGLIEGKVTPEERMMLSEVIAKCRRKERVQEVSE